MSELTRRQFLKVTGFSLVGSSLAMMGFSPEPALAEVREYKLSARHRDAQYLSLLFGCLRHSDVRSRRCAQRMLQPSIFHIEGDPDHPVNRGTLCPKGAGLIDFIHSESRLKVSRVSRAGIGSVAAHILGRCARSHCQTDEAGPRRELRRQDTRRADRQPVADHGYAGRIGVEQRSRLLDRTRLRAHSVCWHSITRLVCDTARRWQVLPRRLAVER